VAPEFALRRSWGSSLERAMLFLALLPQFGIDGCVVAVPAGGRAQAGFRYWIPGALVDGEIYLFDPRLGMPLPGPTPSGVATLKQVREQPQLLQALTLGEKHRYDVTAEQVKQAEVHVGAFLSALAPRMGHLENILATHNKVDVG